MEVAQHRIYFTISLILLALLTPLTAINQLLWRKTPQFPPFNFKIFNGLRCSSNCE
jgi:hypothetical protein